MGATGAKQGTGQRVIEDIFMGTFVGDVFYHNQSLDAVITDEKKGRMIVKDVPRAILGGADSDINKFIDYMLSEKGLEDDNRDAMRVLYDAVKDVRNGTGTMELKCVKRKEVGGEQNHFSVSNQVKLSSFLHEQKDPESGEKFQMIEIYANIHTIMG